MYKISKKTIYLEYDGNNTVIKTSTGDVNFKGNVLKNVLNYNCILYGSSLNGRKKASQVALKSKYKLPVVVSEKEKLLFFPINEEGKEIWVNYEMVKDLKKEESKVKVEFKNGYVKVFNVKFTIFNNMIMKSSRLWVIFLS